jgi:hypothetical protein
MSSEIRGSQSFKNAYFKLPGTDFVNLPELAAACGDTAGRMIFIFFQLLYLEFCCQIKLRTRLIFLFS